MGFGFIHLHTEQEIARLKDTIIHTHGETATGSLYWSSYYSTRDTFFHQVPNIIINYLATHSLVKTTLLFHNEHRLQLHHYISIPIKMHHDFSIMNLFQQTGLLPIDLVSWTTAGSSWQPTFYLILLQGMGALLWTTCGWEELTFLLTGESPGLVNIAPLPMTGTFGGAKYGVAFWHEENI